MWDGIDKKNTLISQKMALIFLAKGNVLIALVMRDSARSWPRDFLVNFFLKIAAATFRALRLEKLHAPSCALV